MVSSPVHAELPELGGEILKEPICFTVRNTADHMIYGNIGTNYYMDPQYETKARHRSNFRFEAAGAKDDEGYPADQAEFCSYGPFFKDRKLELSLRTLFPVFSCQTKVDQGEIIIKSERKEDDSGVKIWAECFE